MFSLPGVPKLVVLIAVIVVVWQVFKLLGRFQRAREAEARLRQAQAQAQARAQAQAKGQRREVNRGAVAETRQCRVCGAYVAQGAGSCGKPGCPFGG